MEATNIPQTKMKKLTEKNKVPIIKNDMVERVCNLYKHLQSQEKGMQNSEWNVLHIR